MGSIEIGAPNRAALGLDAPYVAASMRMMSLG
jgi:hypothetical protein